MDLEDRIKKMEDVLDFLVEDYKNRNPLWDIKFESEQERNAFILKCLKSSRESIYNNY